MKSVFIFLTIGLIFSSCAHKGVKTQLGSLEQDSLHRESFMRYNSSRHKKLRSKNNFLLTQLSLCHQGESQEVFENLKGQLAQEEKNPYYWVVLANCYMLEEDYQKANFYYQTALQKRPKKNVRALISNNLGVLSLKNRSYDEALKHFKSAGQKAPQSLTPKFNLSQLHIQFGHLKKARQVLLMLEKKAPQDIDVLAALGTIALMEGQNKKAINYFESIPEVYRKRQDIAVHYALALYQNEQWEKARAFMLKVGLMTSPYLREIERNLSSRIDHKLKTLEKVQQ